MMRTQTLKWYTPEEKEPPVDRILLAKIDPAKADLAEEVLEIEIVVWSESLNTLYSLDMYGLHDIFKSGCLKEWADTGIAFDPWDEVYRLQEELRDKAS
jgi:hypothetical protein